MNLHRVMAVGLALAAPVVFAQGMGQGPGMGMGMGKGQMALCPAAVQGTKVEYADSDGGGTMTFTNADAEKVKDLRARVTAMAARHEQMCMQKKGMNMNPEWTMPASTAKAEEVKDGVKLVVTAKDAKDLALVRERLKKRADVMAQGRCPMADAKKK